MTTDGTKTRPLPGFAANATPEEIAEGREISAANSFYFETEGLRDDLLAILARCGFVTAQIGMAPGDRIAVELRPEEAERLVAILLAARAGS